MFLLHVDWMMDFDNYSLIIVNDDVMHMKLITFLNSLVFLNFITFLNFIAFLMIIERK